MHISNSPLLDLLKFIASKQLIFHRGGPGPGTPRPTGSTGYLSPTVWLERKAGEDLARLSLEPHNTGAGVIMKLGTIILENQGIETS